MGNTLLIVFTLYDRHTKTYINRFVQKDNLPEDRENWDYFPVFVYNELVILLVNDIFTEQTQKKLSAYLSNFKSKPDNLYVLYHCGSGKLAKTKLAVSSFAENTNYFFADVHHNKLNPNFTNQLIQLSEVFSENINFFKQLLANLINSFEKWIPDTINKELSKLNTAFLEIPNPKKPQKKIEILVPDKKVMVVWDKIFATDNAIEQKLKPFLISALKQKNKHYQPENLIFKTDYEDLLKSVSDSDLNFADYELIIVHAELSSIDYMPGQFKGIELVKNLRLAKFKTPVIICSALDKHYYYKQNKLDFNVLKTPSTYFIHLPSPEIDLKTEDTLAELDDKTLDDLQYYELQPNGFYHELLHTYKRQLKDNLTNATAFEKLFDQFCFAVLPLISDVNDKKLFIKDAVEIKHYVQYEAIKNEDKEERLNRFYKNTEKFIPGSSGKHETYKNEIFKTEWNVLYIDDDEKCRNELKAIFDDYQISYIPYTPTQTFPANGEEAFQMLKNDCNDYKKIAEEDVIPQKGLIKIKGKSKITAVVTDWRFINHYGEWHKYQGLKIIDYIVNNLNTLVCFFILTEKTGGINKLLKAYQDVKSFTKPEIRTPDGLYRFVETLRNEGEQMWERVQNMPNTRWWDEPNKRMNATKSYKDYYTYFVTQDFKKELQIGREAMEYIEQAVKYKEDIGGKNITLSTNVKPKPEFFLEPTGDLSSEKDYENYQKFLKRLIARRIALGLTMLGWDKNEIGRILLSDTGSSRKDQNYSELFTQGLAMVGKIGALIENNQILKEEQNWLKYKLNENFSCEFKTLRNDLLVLFTSIQKKIQNTYDEIDGLEQAKYISFVEKINEVNFKKHFLSTTLINEFLKQITTFLNFDNSENRFQKIKEAFITQWKIISLKQEYGEIIKKNKWDEIMSNIV